VKKNHGLGRAESGKKFIMKVRRNYKKCKEKPWSGGS
jgi:hypothetical protein